MAPPPPITVNAPSLEDEVVPLKGLKKAMVKSMQQSLRIPHFGYNDEIDVTKLIEYVSLIILIINIFKKLN